MTRYSTIFEDIKLNKGIMPIVFKLEGSVRRLVLVLMILRDDLGIPLHPVSQVFILLFMALLHLCYLTVFKPFESKKQNNFEIYNNSVFYVVVICMQFLTQARQNNEKVPAFDESLVSFAIKENENR